MLELDNYSSSLTLSVYEEKVNLSPTVQANTKLLLYIGVNAISICEKMLALGYVGLSIPNVIKAYNWLHYRVNNELSVPDAIICDFNLPDASLRFLRTSLQNNHDMKDIPLIFFAQEKYISDIKRAASYRADDLFYQGYDPLDLHYRIEFIQQHKALLNAGTKRISDKHKIQFTTKFHFWKRAFDIIVALAALILFSPIFLIIAVMIKLDSKGGIFYISKRAGRNYKIFDFYKFRTMKEKADAELATLLDKYNLYKNEDDTDISFVKFNNDPRITRVGKWLRKTSLDELPQLINVLKGDMSLVGNRPLPLYEASTLTKDGAASRFLAPAGITGLWQISKNRQEEMSVSERIMLDVQYAQETSIWTDLSIMLKTFPAMLQKEEDF